MDQTTFKDICHDASLRLRLPDVEALGRGAAVMVDGTIMEIADTNRGDRLDAYLFVEVGVPVEDHRAEAYQALLGLQMLLIGTVEGMFVYDAVNDRVLFAARLPLWRAIDGAVMADILKAMAAQARTWRGTLLAGQLSDAQDPRQGFAQAGLGRLV